MLQISTLFKPLVAKLSYLSKNQTLLAEMRANAIAHFCIKSMRDNLEIGIKNVSFSTNDKGELSYRFNQGPQEELEAINPNLLRHKCEKIAQETDIEELKEVIKSAKPESFDETDLEIVQLFSDVFKEGGVEKVIEYFRVSYAFYLSDVAKPEDFAVVNDTLRDFHKR
ncbi:MAG: hypothetical protein AAF244_01635 [Pseudomonadota bacterium]